MSKLVSEVIGTGNQEWLGSTHAMRNAQSVPLLRAAFTAGTHYPNGYFPSGLPIGKYTSGANSGKYGPYTPGATDGSQNLYGFVLTDVSSAGADAYVNAPVLDHGRINTNKLPIAFTAPSPDGGHFVFTTKS